MTKPDRAQCHAELLGLVCRSGGEEGCDCRCCATVEEFRAYADEIREEIATAIREQGQEIELLKNQRCENPTIYKDGTYMDGVIANQLDAEASRAEHLHEQGQEIERLRTEHANAVDLILKLRDENERLRGAINTLVLDEVISASKARELTLMTPEQQREHWRAVVPRNDSHEGVLDELEAAQQDIERLKEERDVRRQCFAQEIRAALKARGHWAPTETAGLIPAVGRVCDKLADATDTLRKLPCQWGEGPHMTDGDCLRDTGTPKTGTVLERCPRCAFLARIEGKT